MHHFSYRAGVLHAEGVAIPQIAAEVGSNPNGIGYVGYAYAGAKGTKIVTIESSPMR